MSDEDTQRILKNWEFLRENLVQHEIRDRFIDKAVWDHSHFEKIDAEKTPRERNEMFLEQLLDSDFRAYEVFIAALKEKGSNHIIEKLQITTIEKHFLKLPGKYCRTYIWQYTILF